MKRLRTPAMHVATTKRQGKSKEYVTHLVRHTYRDKGKVKHRTLANITHLPEDVIELVRRALRGETLAPVHEAFNIVRSLPHGHVAAVLDTLRKLGLHSTIASKPSRQRDLVVTMIVARVINPRSKLATARSLDSETALTSLGQSLGVESADEDDLYHAMDWLLGHQAKIEKSLAKKHLSDGSLVLYDVTSTYFEGRTCPLARRGYSRDGKRGSLQIVFGLLCNADGCPVGVEVFEGDVADPMTIASQVRKLREQFGLSRVVVVGDRGMLTEARLREDFRDEEGFDWITALRAPAIRKLVENGCLQPSLFDARHLAEITSPDYPGERLIVCRNPLVAEDRKRTREELLDSTERALEKIAVATRREKNRLRGKDRIGMRVGKVLNRFKVGKHFILEIGDHSFSYSRDETKIAEEAALDGFYVIRTSVPAEELGSEGVVRAYKGLSRAERAFRSLKTIDLKVRPIHHRLEDRVRAHVFLCMLAYYVEWHMRRALAPLLFDDDDAEGAEELREDVVSPAKRSERAERKARTKRTADGFRVHSFRTLLADLGTLTKNTCTQPALGASHTFEMLTHPTPIQQRAFDLLELTPRL